MTAKAQRRHRRRRQAPTFPAHELADIRTDTDGRPVQRIPVEPERKRRPFSWLTWGALRHRVVGWLRDRGLAKQRRGNYASQRYTGRGRRRR